MYETVTFWVPKRDGTNLTLTELGAAERLSGSNVTPGFLTLLGVIPALGRTFHLSDVGQRVVIISEAFWRGKLAADPDVIGRQIVLGSQAHTIVGVLPEHFFAALNRSDFWRPFPVTPAQAVRAGYRVRVVARLAGDVAPAHVERALDDVSRTSSLRSRRGRRVIHLVGARPQRPLVYGMASFDVPSLAVPATLLIAAGAAAVLPAARRAARTDPMIGLRSE